MSFNIIPTGKFKKEAKNLIKKYPSLKQELAELSEWLMLYPDSGFPLGMNIFKIRIAIKSKGKGKSGGGRVITYLISEKQEVYLLTIYDKSEFDSIYTKILQTIIENI